MLSHSIWPQCVKVSILWRKPYVPDGSVAFYGEYVSTDLRGGRASALFPCVDEHNAWSTYELQVRTVVDVNPVFTSQLCAGMAGSYESCTETHPVIGAFAGDSRGNSRECIVSLGLASWARVCSLAALMR